VTRASGEKYVLVKGFAGLGNRMFVALSAILYAQLSGRRLVFDWNDSVYSDDGSDVFRHFFVCAGAGGIEEIPATDSVAPAIWRGRLGESVSDVYREYNRLRYARLLSRLERARVVRRSVRRARFRRRSSIAVSTLAYEERVAVLAVWPVRLDAMRPFLRRGSADLAHTATAAIQRSLLAETLLLHPRLRARVDAFREAHFNGPTAGVHLRLSDRRVRVEAILEALDELRRRRPDLGVFGATDSIEGKELLERRYPDVIMTSHWFPPRGRPLHNNPEVPSRLENGVEALVDLYLLGGSDFFVGDTTSSFARLASLLASPDRTIDVRPPRRYAELQGEIWRRYAASESLAGSLVRTASRIKHPIGTVRRRPT
jgi:hypothetical protein